MNQYPNLWLTSLLALTLIPPFALKFRYPDLEPYPAIILPSGAGKVNVTAKEISFIRDSFWGKRENDTWTRIDKKAFFEPIPVRYLHPLARDSFGLNSAAGKNVILPKGVSVSTKKVTPSEVQSTKHWLRQRLAQSGYATDELMITFEKVIFDIETGEIISSKRKHEEILRLD